MLTVIGVRHGEVHNPKHVIYAGLDGYGLSELGRSQAGGMADAIRELPIAAIYASPLDRAIETAGFLSDATGVAVTPDIRLHEWRYWQQWAGMTWEELRDKGRDAWEAYQSDPGSVTAGESLVQLADRMTSWLSDVAAAHDEGIVIGVSHLEPLRTALLTLLGRPAKDLFNVNVGLCEAVRLVPDPDATAVGSGALSTLLV